MSLFSLFDLDALAAGQRLVDPSWPVAPADAVEVTRLLNPRTFDLRDVLQATLSHELLERVQVCGIVAAHVLDSMTIPPRNREVTP